MSDVSTVEDRERAIANAELERLEAVKKMALNEISVGMGADHQMAFDLARDAGLTKSEYLKKLKMIRGIVCVEMEELIARVQRMERLMARIEARGGAEDDTFEFTDNLSNMIHEIEEVLERIRVFRDIYYGHVNP